MFSWLSREDRQFLFSWSLYTGAGSLAATLLLSLVFNLISIPAISDGSESEPTSLAYLIASIFVFAVPGIMIGLGQWLELRNLIPRAGWWILATALGWILGFAIGQLAYSFLADIPPIVLLLLPWFVVGLISGFGQWRILRDHWSNTGPWIIVAVLAAIIGGFSWLIAGTLGGAIGWIIAGAVSGYALLVLRDRSLMS